MRLLILALLLTGCPRKRCVESRIEKYVDDNCSTIFMDMGSGFTMPITTCGQAEEKTHTVCTKYEATKE
jgi:hypothetical protein